MPIHRHHRRRAGAAGIASTLVLALAMPALPWRDAVAADTDPDGDWADAQRIELAALAGPTEWAAGFALIPPTVVLRPQPDQLWVVFSLPERVAEDATAADATRWRIAFDTTRGVVAGERIGGSSGRADGQAIESTVYALPAGLAPGEARAVLVQAPRDSRLMREIARRSEAHAQREARIAELAAALDLPRLALGQPFETTFATLDGGRIDTRQLRGKPVLVEFWATWCAPCARSARALAALRARVGADRFTLLGVSIDDDLAAVRAFTARHGADWPQSAAGDGERGEALLQALFGEVAVPAYVLLDGEGVVRHLGYGEVDAQAFEQRLRDLDVP